MTKTMQKYHWTSIKNPRMCVNHLVNFIDCYNIDSQIELKKYLMTGWLFFFFCLLFICLVIFHCCTYNFFKTIHVPGSEDICSIPYECMYVYTTLCQQPGHWAKIFSCALAHWFCLSCGTWRLPLVTVWMLTPAGEDFPFNHIGPNVQTLGDLCIFSSQ